MRTRARILRASILKFYFIHSNFSLRIKELHTTNIYTTHPHKAF